MNELYQNRGRLPIRENGIDKTHSIAATNLHSETSLIRLLEAPYVRTISETGEVVDCTNTLDMLAKSTGYKDNLRGNLDAQREHLQPLLEGGYNGIYSLLANGKQLSFDQAFSAMTLVCMGSNRELANQVGQMQAANGQPQKTEDTLLLQSVSLMSALAGKEGYSHLTAEEIAGLVAPVVTLDTVGRINSDKPMVIFGGMGGDKGYARDKTTSKLFSSSTMGSIALSVLEPVHKHHSYPNTSKVAGQTAIEEMGARSDFDSMDEMETIQATQDLLMSSCHTIRTVHTISHKLKGETINHVVGPLAAPVQPNVELSALIGVNEKVHPQTIIDALKNLSEKGVQSYGNSAAFCGLSLTNEQSVPSAIMSDTDYYNSRGLREVVRLDEVAPPPYLTLASFLKDGQNAGTFIIEPDDFYPGISSLIAAGDLMIENSARSINEANLSALTGSDTPKMLYLAMTVALGRFTKHYLQQEDALDASNHRVNNGYLRTAFKEAVQVIMSGRAIDKKDEYVRSTKIVCENKPALSLL